MLPEYFDVVNTVFAINKKALPCFGRAFLRIVFYRNVSI